MRPALVRAAFLGLGLTAVGLAGAALRPEAALAPLASAWAERPLGPTPPPPTIHAPRGALPDGPAGLEAWAHYRAAPSRRAGSGFLLRLADGRIVGVLAAHGLALTDSERVLETVTFLLPGEAGPAAEFAALHGAPGRARSGADMTVDYILLVPSGPVDDGRALEADPRGGPQPGERVLLFSGETTRAGTALTAEAEAVWAVMDEVFDPQFLSGAPLLSQHTGLVVGMAIATARRGGRLTLGFHPIGSLARLAEAAGEAQALAEPRP